MKRKQQNKSKKKKDDNVTIGDHLNQELFSKLKEKHKELKHEAQTKIEEEKEKIRKERIQKEKNKSFEELLNESDLDWKSFKE